MAIRYVGAANDQTTTSVICAAPMNSRRRICPKRTASPISKAWHFAPGPRVRIATDRAQCPLMGWSGRAPAPPAIEAGKGRQDKLPCAAEIGWHSDTDLPADTVPRTRGKNLSPNGERRALLLILEGFQKDRHLTSPRSVHGTTLAHLLSWHIAVAQERPRDTARRC